MVFYVCGFVPLADSTVASLPAYRESHYFVFEKGTVLPYTMLLYCCFTFGSIILLDEYALYGQTNIDTGK